jgi:protease-4
MRFLGKLWRVLVGVKDALVLLFMLMFFGLLYAMLSASPSVGPGERGALVLDLSGAIVEQPAQLGAAELLSGSGAVREYRRRDVVHALRKAAEDERIEAVVLDLDLFTGGGQVALSDVGDALDLVRRANKRVLAYATAYSDDGYQLAAHADEVWMDPMGAVLVTGPGGTNLYYKGLLDKLGVTANVYKAGTYKAAVEPFTRNDMSPEARESIQAVADALWENWLADVGKARPKAQLPAYTADMGAQFDRAGGDMARAALAAGLVDKLGDRTAFGKRVAEITGAKDDSVPGSFKAIRYDRWSQANPVDADGQIGVLTVAGEIVDGEAEAGTAGAETVTKRLRKAVRERNLKALVVRVDSPGGSVYGSERIRQAILDAKATGLPVVVSMGSVAASGGYWISMAADHVMAEPGTITGSIGVFGIVPSFQGSLQKMGIGADGIKTTPMSGEPDLFRGPSPEANRLIQMSVDDTYRRFLRLVSTARKLPVARVDRIAQGRVWDGGTARQLGLIDRFGSLDDAIAEAARRAKIDAGDADVAWLDDEPGFWDSMFQSWAVDEDEEDASRDALARISARPMMLLEHAIVDARRLVSTPSIQARCLECPPIAPARLTRADRSRLVALFDHLMR